MSSDWQVDRRSPGRTESDAIHPRFLEAGAPVRMICLSCNDYFVSASNLDVLKHFQDVEHVRYYRRCLYCAGKVHAFCDATKQKQFYHDCFRWKRGLDK